MGYFKNLSIKHDHHLTIGYPDEGIIYVVIEEKMVLHDFDIKTTVTNIASFLREIDAFSHMYYLQKNCESSDEEKIVFKIEELKFYP
jgi:hypothetical protein